MVYAKELFNIKMLKRTSVYLVFIVCDGCGFKDVSPLAVATLDCGWMRTCTWAAAAPATPSTTAASRKPTTSESWSWRCGSSPEDGETASGLRLLSPADPLLRLTLHPSADQLSPGRWSKSKNKTTSCTFHCDVHCEQVIHELLHSSAYWRAETSTSLVAVDRFLVGPLLWVWELDFGTC